MLNKAERVLITRLTSRFPEIPTEQLEVAIAGGERKLKAFLFDNGIGPKRAELVLRELHAFGS